ncbi:MAG: MBL fold metallo-hydrolase [Phycisphaerales bacterium]|nr:MBL fold metallo-hydrolase [Phycisphaerales bacterium]
MDVRIVSLGALSSHPLRGERAGVRAGHGTTTLIRGGKRVILVDPGLPDAALAARLDERAGLPLSAVTHVFLTSFNPELRRGLPALGHATWWIGGVEREQIGVMMATELKRLAESGGVDAPARSVLEQDVALLRRTEPAPESLATDGGERVDLFPLPGVTPGLCGLLIAGPRHTTLVCGDAVPTIEHLEQGKVLPSAADVTVSRESFAEAVEIADLLILGRDGLVVNPTRRPF